MTVNEGDPKAMESIVQPILDALPDSLPTAQRFVIAIAGPPASGKSTIAHELCAALAPSAAVLGMDAFHYDNQILEPRGDLPRKGAPHTFDADGYGALLGRIRAEPTNDITVPEFDRSLELTRNAAGIVSTRHQILITEGNYLLLDEKPWSALGPLFDFTVWLHVPLSVVEARITQRWLDHGLTPSQAAERLAANDLPNAQLVNDRSRSADISISAV